MRIIIELDTTTQPEVQVGSQSTGDASNSQGATASSGKAIDAGASKAGAAQPQSSPQEMDSSGNYQQPPTDSGSAGSAPGNMNG